MLTSTVPSSSTRYHVATDIGCPSGTPYGDHGGVGLAQQGERRLGQRCLRHGILLVQAGVGCVEPVGQGGDQRVGGALDHLEDHREAVRPRRSRGRDVGARVDRVVVAEHPDPLRPAAEVGEVVGVHGQHQVVRRRPTRRRTDGRDGGSGRTRPRRGRQPRDGPSGRRRASRRCRCCARPPGRRAPPRPAAARGRRGPWESGRCCPGRPARRRSAPGRARRWQHRQSRALVSGAHAPVDQRDHDRAAQGRPEAVDVEPDPERRRRTRRSAAASAR